MRGHLVDIEDAQPMLRENFLDRQHGQVGKVLVIYRVELHLLDKIQQCGNSTV